VENLDKTLKRAAIFLVVGVGSNIIGFIAFILMSGGSGASTDGQVINPFGGGATLCLGLKSFYPILSLLLFALGLLFLAKYYLEKKREKNTILRDVGLGFLLGGALSLILMKVLLWLIMMFANSTTDCLSKECVQSITALSAACS